MKTKILKVLLILPFLTNAQFLNYGLKAGLNLTDADTGFIYTSPNNATFISNSQSIKFGVDTSLMASFYIGAFTEFSFKKKSRFTLQLELIYNQNGTTIKQKDGNTNDNLSYSTSGAKIKVSQLNIPLLLKFYPKNNFSIDGGIYTGYVLGIKSISPDGVTFNVDDNFINKIDFGLIVGATYNLKNNMFIELRYNHGLIDIDNLHDESYGESVEVYYKNRTIHFGVGYKF